MAVLYKKFLVIGNNPDEIIKAFDGDTIVEPYIAYDYGKKEIYHQNKIKYLTTLLKQKSLSNDLREFFEEELEETKLKSDEDFYYELTYGMTLDEDLNVISDKNPNAKFIDAEVANESNAYPFILKDGTKSFSAKVGDIDWVATAGDTSIYKRTWDLIVKNDKPKEQWEITAKSSGPSRETLLMNYGSRENYVAFNTAFFTPYVALMRKGNPEWDVWDTNEQVKWVLSFYKTYLKKLPEETLITLYATPNIF